MIFSITTDDDGSIVGMSAVVPTVQPVTLILAELPPVGEPVSVPDSGDDFHA